jgi:hypothetical protein
MNRLIQMDVDFFCLGTVMPRVYSLANLIEQLWFRSRWKRWKCNIPLYSALDYGKRAVECSLGVCRFHQICPPTLSGVPQRLLIRKSFREFVPSLTIVPRLQIEPEALGHPEVVRQAMRDFGVDRTLTLNDLVDSSCRNIDISREAKDADSAGGEEFL